MLKQSICIFFIIISTNAFSLSNAKDQQIFQKIFSEWADAFNHKNLSQTCGLFSPTVIADYKGVPKKNYQTLCNGFRQIFKETNKRYQYQFKLHQVYRSDHLAALRITWYLTVYEHGKPTSHTQDEGIDIFEKNRFNRWKIVNYIAYEK